MKQFVITHIRSEYVVIGVADHVLPRKNVGKDLTKYTSSVLISSLAAVCRIVGLHEKVSTVWPEFSANGKEDCTVAHVLNHTAGLHNALSNQFKEDPFIMCKWDEVLKELADSAPDSRPGTKQAYHALTYGWLCGGIIERASGKKFQELLEEVLVCKLGVEGGVLCGHSSRCGNPSCVPHS
ncbi:hypothetical protein L7F22_032612 [Adiantum nelumboides]|nr:hypothetical protein [Adiantum nelumboides]